MAITLNRPSGGISRCGAIILAIDADTKQYVTPAIYIAYTKANKAVTQLEIKITVRTNSLVQTINVANQSPNSTNVYEVVFPALSDTNFPTNIVAGSNYASATLDSVGVSVSGAGSGYIKIIIVRNTSTTNVDLTFIIDGQTFVEPISGRKGAIIILDNTPSTSSIVLKDANNTGSLVYYELTVQDTAKNSDDVTISLVEKDSFGNIIDSGSITEAFYWLNIAYATSSGRAFIGYKVTE